MDEQAMEQDMMSQQIAAGMGRTAYIGQQQELNTLLSELTNPEPDIREVELSLKGKSVNADGEVVELSEPLLNDKGVAHMLKLLRSMVSRLMFMSNLEEDQIRIMTQELGEEIVSTLVMHKRDFNIKSYSSMSTIRTIITYKAFESGMSALDNGFRRFLKQGIVETTISTQGTTGKTPKAGFLNWGKK